MTEEQATEILSLLREILAELKLANSHPVCVPTPFEPHYVPAVVPFVYPTITWASDNKKTSG